MTGFPDLEAVRRNAEQTWATDASIRAEFGSRDSFAAYAVADARGLVRARSAPVVRLAEIDNASAAQDAGQAWDTSADIRAEFGTRARYVAFQQASAESRVGRVVGRTVLSGDDGESHPHQLPASHQTAPGAGTSATPDTLSVRQARIRQENVGRQFAGMAPLPMPQ